MVLPLLALLVVTAPMPGEVEAQRFKAAFERGEAHFQAGDYGAAIAAFREADRQRVTPEVAFDLAKCHEKLGDEAYAVYYYRLYMRRAPNAPDTLDVAEVVGNALGHAENEGWGFLELDAPRATAVTVAGRRYPAPPVAVFLPPGDYEVSAEFPSGPKTMSVQIRTGKTASLAFEPVAPPLVGLEAALSPELALRDTAATPGPSSLRVASYVVAGAGLAAVLAGAAVGALATGDASRAADRSLPVSEAQGYAASANGKGVGANLLFGLGGAAVVGGALLFVFSMPEPGLPAGGAGGSP